VKGWSVVDSRLVKPPFAPLVVMVGPPGSGKSTWAASWFPHDQLFGLDMFRRLLTGYVLEQDATESAAEMMAAVLNYRMATARTTVVDATNTNWERRDQLRWHAQRHGRPAVAVMMHTPLAVCLERNAARTTAPWPGANDRPLDDESVIERMHAAAIADPPTPDDFDLVVHVHPTDAGVAYAYPGKGRPVTWCEQLLGSDRWGQGITLLTGRQASLPWPAPVNCRG
jgi:predicted kinase